jgi:hypothetical protein
VLEPDGKRFGHCRPGVVEARRNLHDEVLVEEHVFAEPARTFVVIANDAVCTRLPHYWHRRNPRARPDGSPAARTIVDYLADVFMAGHEEFVEIETGIGTAVFPRELDHLFASSEKVDVGRAEPTRMGANEHLALAWHRIGHITDLNPTG